MVYSWCKMIIRHCIALVQETLTSDVNWIKFELHMLSLLDSPVVGMFLSSVFPMSLEYELVKLCELLIIIKFI